IPKGINRPKKTMEISTSISPKDKVSSIIRKVIALYLVGFNTIRLKVKGERLPIERREEIKSSIRRMLVGTEIISDSKDEMVLQVLLSSPELSVSDALRRIAIIAVSMHKDAVDSLRDMNFELAKEVINNDDEIDRFSFYVIRQLKAAVEDEKMLREIDLDNPKDCLGYRLITKSAERVADHAVNIALNVLTIKNPIDDDIFKALNEMSSKAILEFEDAMISLFTKHYSLADEVVEKKKLIESYETELIGQIIRKKLDAETASTLRLIIESIKRTSEYGSDIAEVVLNLTALKPEQETDQSRDKNNI
ncbi:MAG: phosphate uptake regulator PhoU, partial [Candidatus Bathyarchaeota archaeon]